MQVVLVCDIYGRRPYLEHFADQLQENDHRVHVVDMYQGDVIQANNESEAYQYFLNCGGHDAYADHLESELAQFASPCVVIGFSAGAGAAWRVTSRAVAKNVHSIVGFYPSDIRHHLALQTLVPVTLFFPESELHFSVDACMAELSTQALVTSCILPIKHGCCNPLSRHYHQEHANIIFDWLMQQNWHSVVPQNLVSNMASNLSADVPSYSVIAMQRGFVEQSDTTLTDIPSWYFCDNQSDADECAGLVLQGIKRATTTSLWWFEHSGESVPQVGDINIVTDWAGEATCVIETTSVEIVPYSEITADYAFLEGEGDKSLAYWQKVHWAYYHRELAQSEFVPTQDMPLVCEQFKVVFK